jgi:hypothetical protein
VRCGETRLVADAFGQWPDAPLTAGTGLSESPRAIVMPDPVKQFRDNNGRPYVNGLLWSYHARTRVPLRTFRDAGLTDEHENPVTLDLDGRATIYLAAQIYKFILQTANGVTVWEQDDVQGSVWTGAVAGWSVQQAADGQNAVGHRFASEIKRADTGTHSWVIGTRFDAPLICPGTAGVTVAATLTIATAPTAGTENVTLWVAAVSADPVTRFNGDVSFGDGLTAIGTGATATMGLIGGGGPDMSAQSGWQRFIRADGTVGFIPYWVGPGTPTEATVLHYSGPTTGTVNLSASVVGMPVLNLSPGVWTFTVTGQATMTVTATAGGGGGGGDTGAGGGSTSGSGGGGGGGRGDTDVVMVKTKVYAATVGGNGAGQFGTGTDGGDTIFGEETLNLVVVRGGKGGTTTAGGAGGLAVGGSNLINGGAGGAGGLAGAFGGGGLCNVNGAGGGGGGSGGGGGGLFGGAGGGSAGTTVAGVGGINGQNGQPSAGTGAVAQGGGVTGGVGCGGGGGGGGGARLADGIGYGGGGGGAGASNGNGGAPGGDGGPGGVVFVLKSLP